MPFLRNDAYRNGIEGSAVRIFGKIYKPTAIITSYDMLTNSDLYQFRFRDRVNYWTNSEKLIAIIVTLEAESRSLLVSSNGEV